MFQTQIFWVDAIAPCRLGLSARPYGGEDLALEVQAWVRAHVEVVVSLLEVGEARELALESEPALCKANAIEFRAFPIPDRGVPKHCTEFGQLLDLLQDRLRAGRSVVIHCRAGIGRTGIVAACLAFRLGVPLHQVFTVLSRSRGITMPDTTEQIEWVHRYLAPH